MRWHKQLRDNHDKLPHRNPQAAAGKKPRPPFFLEFLEAKLVIICKADELLKTGELLVGIVQDYINKKLIP